MRRTLPAALLLALAALCVMGCPGDIEFVPDIPAGCSARPVFELLSPNPNGMQEFDGDSMDINVDVGNFSIVGKTGEPAGVCEGHFHVSIDSGDIFVMVETTMTVDISDLEDGVHALVLTVHHNDHSRIAGIDPIETTFVRDAEPN